MKRKPTAQLQLCGNIIMGRDVRVLLQTAPYVAFMDTESTGSWEVLSLGGGGGGEIGSKSKDPYAIQMQNVQI
jgi:hypothetical protein